LTGPLQGVGPGGVSRPLAEGASLLAAPPSSAPVHPPSCVGARSGETGLIKDKHQRNAVLGHTLGLIEAQLDFLRCVSPHCLAVAEVLKPDLPCSSYGAFFTKTCLHLQKEGGCGVQHDPGHAGEGRACARLRWRAVEEQ
jgi:hypothetical protein